MELTLIWHTGFCIGFYLVVAQDRGRLVGIVSALIWPLIAGTWVAHCCLRDENEIDWSKRVTWLGATTPKKASE